eukprot:CCRYP_014474-RA/>CCRYP_014474-RA protein AED:0.53 eAED:0.53 QI:0/0/0/0.5/0/0/2/0/121
MQYYIPSTLPCLFAIDAQLEHVCNGVVHPVTKETITKYKKLANDPLTLSLARELLWTTIPTRMTPIESASPLEEISSTIQENSRHKWPTSQPRKFFGTQPSVRPEPDFRVQTSKTCICKHQ